MRSDLQCLDHVRIAVVPACLWLIGGGTDGRRYQGIDTSERRPCCVSRTRSGPGPPGHARSTRTRKMRVALQMEGFQAEDRHNPSPHIALLTAALKSAYRNTASTSSRTTAELWELLIPGGRK